jgi:hypothetical protein
MKVEEKRKAKRRSHKKYTSDVAVDEIEDFWEGPFRSSGLVFSWWGIGDW